MTTTRRQPVEIFEDAAETSNFSEFGPITDFSLDQHTILRPTTANSSAASPHKSSDHPSSSPPPSALAEANLNRISFPRPQKSGISGSPMKKSMPPPKRMASSLGSKRSSSTAELPSYSDLFDQENAPPPLSGEAMMHTFELVPEKKGAKRALTDTTAAKDRSSKKQKTVDDDAPFPVPEPDEMPPVVDPGVKPEHSYAILIGMALLRAPLRRLTLAQIYKWISDNFSFYNPADSGWQNSIRHNLSLNKNFIKQSRPKEDTGKGHYWTIQPGQEHMFLKEKNIRRPSTTIQLLPPNTGLMRPSTSHGSSAPTLSSQPKAVDASKFPEDTELSSDGTIPCSDPAIHDGQDAAPTMPPPSRTLRSSPPPTDMCSSPPAPPSRHSVRDDTPPRPSQFLGHSRSGNRKRKFFGLGDSGYYSSIESSATKAQTTHPLLTSEADFEKPTFKPGRAEHEIVRIRSSSYDSPVKSGVGKKGRGASHIPSSPFNMFDRATKQGAPLTPPVIFKRPAKPPQSVSPNTNLRNHRNRIRELLGTPDRSLNIFCDDRTLTPIFDLPDIAEGSGFDVYGDVPDFDNACDVFNDLDFSLPADRGSPEKRSVKRPKLDRAATSTGALADITGSKSNNRLMSSPTKFLQDPDDVRTPQFKTPRLLKPAPRLLSVAKASTSNPVMGNEENIFLSAPDFQPPADNFAAMFGGELHSDGSEEGFDILQGFQKIGAAPASVAANGSPVKGSRPGLGRSTTSLF